uniref:Uncharacterized protein n=1 Tax=Meloidogyne enterolobii TaxID=390850 RepID=A0A6V7WKF3_MELEN|nr:unnamed protein product [Meloidogyne enterolobii]
MKLYFMGNLLNLKIYLIIYSCLLSHFSQLAGKPFKNTAFPLPRRKKQKLYTSIIVSLKNNLLELIIRLKNNLLK